MLRYQVMRNRTPSRKRYLIMIHKGGFSTGCYILLYLAPIGLSDGPR